MTNPSVTVSRAPVNVTDEWQTHHVTVSRAPVNVTDEWQTHHVSVSRAPVNVTDEWQTHHVTVSRAPVNVTDEWQTHSVSKLCRGITQMQWHAGLRTSVLSDCTASTRQCNVRLVRLTSSWQVRHTVRQVRLSTHTHPTLITASR